MTSPPFFPIFVPFGEKMLGGALNAQPILVRSSSGPGAYRNGGGFCFGLLIGSRPMNSRAIALLSIGAPRMKNLLGRPMNSRAIDYIRDTLLRRGGRPVSSHPAAPTSACT